MVRRKRHYIGKRIWRWYWTQLGIGSASIWYK